MHCPFDNELLVSIVHNKADVLQLIHMYSRYYCEKVDILVLLVLCDIKKFMFYVTEVTVYVPTYTNLYIQKYKW